jgi:hypothetical protein
MAKVDPRRLRESFNEKLVAAQIALGELCYAEIPRITAVEPRVAVTNLLGHARAIYGAAEGFASQEINGTAAAFKAWLLDWEEDLPEQRRELWLNMAASRDDYHHGTGPELITVRIPIEISTAGEGNTALFGLRHGPLRSGASKGGVRFASYPDQTASVIATEYLVVVGKFAADFLRDHAGYIPPA